MDLRLQEYPELYVDCIVINRTTLEDLRKQAADIARQIVFTCKSQGSHL